MPSINSTTRDDLSTVKRELATQGVRYQQERQARLEAEKRASAALQSLREVAQVKEEYRGMVITLGGAVLFASGKSELLPIAVLAASAFMPRRRAYAASCTSVVRRAPSNDGVRAGSHYHLVTNCARPSEKGEPQS